VGSLLDDPSLSPELRARLDLLCVGAVFDALARSPITEHLIFVNLSPLTLEQPEFWNRIQAWVWHLPIPPHRIVMELTQTCAMPGLDQMEGFAQRLRAIGLRMAVGDLGAGVASLANMARLAPDFIKVDRSLVHDAHRHPYQAALLNALALFAERMRVGFIAEGIETLQELETPACPGARATCSASRSRWGLPAQAWLRTTLAVRRDRLDGGKATRLENNG
jgi:EAL domain-containing protein (putative c-di-GMP-specific phosphodiesterase class I)